MYNGEDVGGGILVPRIQIGDQPPVYPLRMHRGGAGSPSEAEAYTRLRRDKLHMNSNIC